MKNNSKKPLDWFESRIGQHIFRKPIFESEQSKPIVSIRVRDKRHAKILFDLQKSNRPEYVDHSSKIVFRNEDGIKEDPKKYDDNGDLTEFKGKHTVQRQIIN